MLKQSPELSLGGSYASSPDRGSTTAKRELGPGSRRLGQPQHGGSAELQLLLPVGVKGGSQRLTAPEVSKVRASPLEHDRDAQLLWQAPIREKGKNKAQGQAPAGRTCALGSRLVGFSHRMY